VLSGGYSAFAMAVPEFVTVESWYKPTLVLPAVTTSAAAPPTGAAATAGGGATGAYGAAATTAEEVIITTEFIDADGYRRGWTFGVERRWRWRRHGGNDVGGDDAGDGSDDVGEEMFVTMSMCTNQRRYRWRSIVHTVSWLLCRVLFRNGMEPPRRIALIPHTAAAYNHLALSHAVALSVWLLRVALPHAHVL
jgi:hypothetical protein